VRIRCPTCGKQDEVTASRSDGAEGTAPQWRPFCSRRCKMIDLGNWLGEVYRFSTPLDPDDVMADRALLSQLMTASHEE
jgi:endogenous inhibitor of DNA gyrase (YacG/DUF329 family)